MNFHYDLIRKNADDETYLVYIEMLDQSLRCIGQISQSRIEEAVWSISYGGVTLPAAISQYEAALKLYKVYKSRSVQNNSDTTDAVFSIEYKLVRLRKRIPFKASLSEDQIKNVRNIPIERRELFLNEVDHFISTLEKHLQDWRKVRAELRKIPNLRIVDHEIDIYQ